MDTQVSPRCCVCGETDSGIQVYAGRYFCDVHIKVFTQDGGGTWNAIMLSILAIAISAGAAASTGVLFARPLNDILTLSSNVIIIFFPITVWGVVVLQQSTQKRLQLSPLIPASFALGALVSAAIAHPFMYDLLDLEFWYARANPSNRIIAYILLGGAVNCASLYGIIRYSVYSSTEFQRRVDGVQFAVSATWGYAAMHMLLFAIDSNGLSMLNGNLRLLTEFPGHLSAGVLLGYFLGRSKFEDMPSYFMPVGFLASMVLNGLVMYIGVSLNIGRVNLVTDGYNPWPGLVVSMIILTLVVFATRGLIRRVNDLTTARLEIST